MKHCVTLLRFVRGSCVLPAEFVDVSMATDTDTGSSFGRGSMQPAPVRPPGTSPMTSSPAGEASSGDVTCREVGCEVYCLQLSCFSYAICGCSVVRRSCWLQLRFSYGCVLDAL